MVKSYPFKCKAFLLMNLTALLVCFCFCSSSVWAQSESQESYETNYNSSLVKYRNMSPSEAMNQKMDLNSRYAEIMEQIYALGRKIDQKYTEYEKATSYAKKRNIMDESNKMMNESAKLRDKADLLIEQIKAIDEVLGKTGGDTGSITGIKPKTDNKPAAVDICPICGSPMLLGKCPNCDR